MLRASVMLAVIPIALFAIVGPLMPAKPPAIVQHKIVTEGIRAQRIDDETFRRRWQPIYGMPPAMQQVHYASDVFGVATHRVSVVDAVPAAASSPTARPPRHRRNLLKTKKASLDICARHKMRRVNYTRPNGWPYWRCRR
jgi:hypothetical protein